MGLSDHIGGGRVGAGVVGGVVGGALASFVSGFEGAAVRAARAQAERAGVVVGHLARREEEERRYRRRCREVRQGSAAAVARAAGDWDPEDGRVARGALARVDGHAGGSWWFDVRGLLEHRRIRRDVVARSLRRGVLGDGRAKDSVRELMEEACVLARRHPERVCELALACGLERGCVVDRAYSVGVLSVAVARELGWSDWDAVSCGVCGVMGDAGLVLVPAWARGWDARGRLLSSDERCVVREHPLLSAGLALEMGVEDRVVRGVYEHHERLDGRGWPSGRSGEGVCDFARVVGVCDEMLGWVSAGHGGWRGLDEVARGASAGVFDREVVRALVEVCGKYPWGTLVRLSDGRIAGVVGRSSGAWVDRPVVRVWCDGADGKRGGVWGETVDLAVEPGVRVEGVVRGVEGGDGARTLHDEAG